MTVFERFVECFERCPSGCWEWTAGQTATGYGAFHMNGKQERAHRAAWIISGGAIPNGMLVCHRCDNPLCVRPSHLFLGTPRDNMEDRDRKGRGRRGENHGRAVLTETQIRDIRAAYAAGGVSLKELADRCGVGQSTIHRAVRGESWGHIA